MVKVFERGLAVVQRTDGIDDQDHVERSRQGFHKLGILRIANPEIRRVVEMLDENTRDFALPHLDMHHRLQGIAHVVAPELGLVQPGMLITCNDSHTATNGAFGALATPIGASNQLRHVIATQTVWMARPKLMRIVIDGTLPEAVTPNA